MEYKDYYKTLGVAKTVGKEDLKKQYRKLARQYHPDANTSDKNAATIFSEISEAYEVLSDDDKRKKYDELGADWKQHQSAGRGDHFDWSRYASGGTRSESTSNQSWEDLFGKDSDSSDFFRNLFGQGMGGRGGEGFARKGQDLSAELAISLEDAYRGGIKTITLGEQQIRLTLRSGIWDHQTIKIPQKGGLGQNGGPPGDLYITFVLQANSEYRLDGTDLYKELPLGVYSAMLGTTHEVQTISGRFKVTIPPETKNRTVFKLKGKGFPIYDTPGAQGDLYLRVALTIPENLTVQEQTLLRELAALRNEKVSGEKK